MSRYTHGKQTSNSARGDYPHSGGGIIGRITQYGKELPNTFPAVPSKRSGNVPQIGRVGIPRSQQSSTGMNPMQAITQREQRIKQQLTEAKANGVWGQPLAALEKQLADIHEEKRKTLENITGLPVSTVSKVNPNAVMGIPDFLLKH